MEKTLGPSWTSFAWRGLASVAFGVVALAWPSSTLATLTILAGIYMLVDGVLAFAIAGARAAYPYRWMLFLEGVLSVIAGFVTLAWPAIGLLTLIFLVGFRAILVGLTQMGAAFQLRSVLGSPWLYGLGGLLAVVFGITALALPGVTAYALVTMLGVYAIFFGIVLFALAYLTRKSGERYPVGVPA